MFARFMPQEGKFFDLFNAHVELIVQGGKALSALLAMVDDPNQDVSKQCDLIDRIEQEADKITSETMQQLHKSFITPLDRDQIHQLITGLDDILDVIQDVAHTINLYDVKNVTQEAIRLGDLCDSCCENVRAAVVLLPSMKNATQMMKICEEIGRLESQADSEMRSAMSKLFREEPDVRELIKLKAVYELLEVITDRCDDVANAIQGIVLENS